jgi:hypothetical protein
MSEQTIERPRERLSGFMTNGGFRILSQRVFAIAQSSGSPKRVRPDHGLLPTKHCLQR